MNIGVVLVGTVAIIGYVNLGVKYFTGKPVWTDKPDK